MAGYYKNSSGGYSVDYNDDRFTEVKTEQAQKETEVNNTYDNIINNSDKYYENQINAAKDYADKQSELQQAQTDFAIEQINQQKEQAQKDYVKEQQGSYVDYMKQTKSNEQNMVNKGLNNTGYSESSIVSMYNQYQGRVATAKESLDKATLNYNNSITQAQLSNSQTLAEIAYNALQTQNQLNQQAFEYKNSIILQKEQALQQINDTYYARYQDVLGQINNEIDLQMKLDEIDREYEQWAKEMEIKRQQLDLEIRKTNADIEATMASIRHTNAQTSYILAQKSALNNSNNPYTSGEDTTTKLSSSAQTLYDKTISVVKSMTTAKSKELARTTVANSLSKALQAGKITDSEMQIIAREAYNILNTNSYIANYAGGSGGGGGR